MYLFHKICKKIRLLFGICELSVVWCVGKKLASLQNWKSNVKLLVEFSQASDSLEQNCKEQTEAWNPWKSPTRWISVECFLTQIQVPEISSQALKLSNYPAQITPRRFLPWTVVKGSWTKVVECLWKVDKAKHLLNEPRLFHKPNLKRLPSKNQNLIKTFNM